MSMILFLVLGFQELDEVMIDVRAYRMLNQPKPVAGSYRVLALMEDPTRVRSDNTVLISVDDLGLIAPIGYTIKVAGINKSVDLGNGLNVSGIWVNRREQIKLIGMAKEVIPKLTPEERSKFSRVSEDNFLQGRSVPVPPRQKTGIGFPGGMK